LHQGVFAETRTEKSRIRCLLVDDHALLRQGVRRLLEDEPDFLVVDEAANAAEAVQKVFQHRPDVVLMDIGMPGLSSFEAARLIQRDCPDTKLIFLTMHEDEEYVMQGLQSGAVGYVLKDTPAPRLVGAMREVHQGGKYVSPEVLGKLVQNVRSRREGPRLVPRSFTLTPREREVVKMLAEGNSVREVASLLGLSAKTVDAHKFNLMRKLDIHNKAQLITYAIQKKIVKLPAGA
jgi:DNA-binding NarL/FixJ family response regulator